MKVFLGADHRGYQLKEFLKDWISRQSDRGWESVDCGAFEYDKHDDYVEYAVEVAKNVANQDEDRGIVICGSGVGVELAVNKVAGIFAGLGLNAEQVKAARRDDDINVLSLAADFVNEEQAKEMVKAFLKTEFSAEDRHVRRLEKIVALRQQMLKN